MDLHMLMLFARPRAHRGAVPRPAGRRGLRPAPRRAHRVAGRPECARGDGRARRPLKSLPLAGAIRSTQPMISITTKSPYALAALVELARRRDAPVPIGELARRREIPVQFLEQLFAVLRRAGVLRSQRGVKGGYPSTAPRDGHRPRGRRAPRWAPRPGRKGVFAVAAAAARDVLARTSIADEVEREAQQAAAPMYYI